MTMTTAEKEAADKKAKEDREKMEADNKKKAEEKVPASS
jgi:hypothetical protein